MLHNSCSSCAHHLSFWYVGRWISSVNVLAADKDLYMLCSCVHHLFLLGSAHDCAWLCHHDAGIALCWLNHAWCSFPKSRISGHLMVSLVAHDIFRWTRGNEVWDPVSTSGKLAPSMALRIFMVRHTKSQLKPCRLMKALCMLVLVWYSLCSILCWLFFFSAGIPVSVQCIRRFGQRRHGRLPCG